MEKIYYTDPYQQTFTAEILSILEKEGLFHITLNQTCFYPGSDSQPSDTGWIEDCTITSVYEEDGVIYHISPKKPIKIHKVKCVVNWASRFDLMQQLMAKYLVSNTLLETFHADTVAFHLGQDICSLTIDQVLSNPELRELERLVNEWTAQPVATTILTPTKQELKKLGFKNLITKGQEALRLVQIGDFQPVPSKGLYPHSTLELQLFKIVKSEKNKGSLRIYFHAGGRATRYLLGNETENLDKIQELTTQYQKLLGENRKFKNTIADYEVKEMIDAAPITNDIHIISTIYQDLDLKELQTIGTKLVSYPRVIALLGLMEGKTSHLIFMCSKDIKKISMNHLLKDSITLIDGHGGGTDFAAQGGGKSGSNLSSALDYAHMKVKASL